MLRAMRKTVATVGVLAAAAAGGSAIAGAAGGSDERALTGDTAEKVKAAALERVEGGTVVRVETDADHGSAYEAHVRKADGTEVEVLVNEDFEVTAVRELRFRGGPGPHMGGPPLDALAQELGVSRAKLRDAFEASIEKAEAARRKALAEGLASRLGLDAADVEQALEATRAPFRRGRP